MKILITGGLGHIGSYLISRLVKIKKIKKIYLIDNIGNQRFNVLFNLKNEKIKFIYGDLTNKAIIKKLPKTNIVLHLASLTNAEKSLTEVFAVDTAVRLRQPTSVVKLPELAEAILTNLTVDLCF